MCQTTIDGTSIDTLEELAPSFGLVAEQQTIPAEHLLIDERTPCIAITRLPNGLTHFIVIWRVVGDFVQFMDPESGRRWIRSGELLGMLYRHQSEFPSESWEEWSTSEEFYVPLQKRIQRLFGKNNGVEESLKSIERNGFFCASLDAVTRFFEGVKRNHPRAISGKNLEPLFLTLLSRVQEQGPERCYEIIPKSYWSIVAWPEESLRNSALSSDGESSGGQVRFSGILFVHFRKESSTDDEQGGPSKDGESPEKRDGESITLRHYLLYAARGGLFFTLSAICIAAAGSVFELLLFRSVIEIGQNFQFPLQRVAALFALLILFLGLLLLEFPLRASLKRIGRRFEQHLRLKFFKTLPRLSYLYFQSRLHSDMAMRGHALHSLRTMPLVVGDAIRALSEMLFTVIGICLLQPSSTILILVTVGSSILITMLSQPVFREKELRQRTHSAALTRLYLDALLGAITLRAHGGERAIEEEHSGLMREWLRAARDLRMHILAGDTVVSVIGIVTAFALVSQHFQSEQRFASALLLVFWALSLPACAQRFALALRRKAALKNIFYRVEEPIALAKSYEEQIHSPQVKASMPAGVEILCKDVTVLRSGMPVLEGINLEVGSGRHVAILGSSGSGKSTFLSTLLGTERLHRGVILRDGKELSKNAAELRSETAWIDPAVQLWNRSLLQNLLYANTSSTETDIISRTEIEPLLRGLRHGLQTVLGESGRMLSSGEGQRVRLGRGLLRSHVRLALLDEPFRGLPRSERQRLLKVVREHFREATLLFVTHDVESTLDFDSVVIFSEGKIIEEGNPESLRRREGSHYALLLEQNQQVTKSLWGDDKWRMVSLERGILEERGA